MKSVSPVHPRFVCRVVRQWSALVDQPRPAHLATCADCRAYFAATGEMERALHRGAESWARTAPAPSVDLASNVLRSIRQSAPVSRQSSGWLGLRAAAALAAILVIGGVGVFRYVSPASREGGDRDALLAADAAVVVDAVESLSDQLVDSIIPSAGALVADNPLQRELDSIYSDAQSALGFLALNFLPTSRDATPSAPARRS